LGLTLSGFVRYGIPPGNTSSRLLKITGDKFINSLAIDDYL